MKKRILINFISMFVLLITLTGCSNQKFNGINEKLDSELGYVEDLIFKIANKHAKKEYEEDGKINWKYIKDDIQKINSIWNTLVIDLTQINVSNEDILSFSNDLNELLITASDESEIGLLEKINDMYKKVIIFKQAYSENKNQIEKNKIKNDVLNIYVLINKGEYSNAKNEINKTVENYKGLMSNMDYANENAYNLNKIYVLLEEYLNSINTENYDLIRMKYIITVEEI